MASETLTVLVVDDEPGMRQGAERVLRSFRVFLPEEDTDVAFEIVTAASGEEGLDIIRGRPPQILLLDHKLPGIQGLDVLDVVAKEYGEILPVMITAYASIETAISATKRGAFDFLAKPFTPDELRAVLRKAARHIILRRRAAQLAKEKHQVRFQFISVLAHELKAPLAAVEGYLRILQQRSVLPGSPGYDQAVGRSLERLEGMRKLILDLLDLTRIESGQGPRESVPVDLVEAARKAAEGILPQAQARGIRLSVPEGPPMFVNANPEHVDMILNNLLSNAVKYNLDGGAVDVALARGEAGTTIRVRDTGIGMSDEEAARLFQEFSRIKNAQTRGIQGSGLGLSIVRRLARLYGGDASVRSSPGAGSTFMVTLPSGPGLTTTGISPPSAGVP